jgi:LysM repeat protein
MKTRFSVIIVALLGLMLMAACTRSASTETVPSATPGGQNGGVQPGSDPTMDALGTQLAATQVAQQAGGSPVPSQIATVATATAIAVTPTVAATAPAAACANPFTVRQGDWIYKIARECRLDPRAVIAANPGINPNRLTPGQRINLPGATAVPPTVPPGTTATPPPSACTGTYTVKAGDNLFRIAFNCGLTTEQMARRNNIAPPYRIFPGQVLNYP